MALIRVNTAEIGNKAVKKNLNVFISLYPLIIRQDEYRINLHITQTAERLFV